MQQTVICDKCQRPLKNPISIARGLGPQCYGAYQAEQNRQGTRFSNPAEQSDYTYRVTNDPVLVIIDLDKGGMSITNNMAAVVTNIAADMGVDYRLLAMPIIYRDSMGEYDGVHLHDTGAVTFYPLHTQNEFEAIQASLQSSRRF